jgi:hypothetical protein
VLELPLPPGVCGYELVDGERVEVPPVGPTHGMLAGEIFGRMRDHTREHRVNGRAMSKSGSSSVCAETPSVCGDRTFRS